MNRKMIVGVVILLLVGMNVSGDIDTKEVSTTSFDGNILYVGGSGPNNYSSIKDAVSVANHGDTVFVYNGLYYEYDIHIDKSINIIGEDKENAIIDGNEFLDFIFIFDGNEIKVEGFTIGNSHSSRSGILIYSDNNEISNCNFFNNGDGIIIHGNGNQIINCQFYDNGFGIYIYGIDEFVIDNEIEDCTFGPYNHLIINRGNNHHISNCIFFESFIRFEVSCNNNLIFGCDIINSPINGIALSADGVNNHIENCIILNADGDGIDVSETQIGLRIFNCSISNSGYNNIMFGINLYDCKIKNCKLINATFDGICFDGRIRRVEVSECHFEDNDAGIQIFGSNFLNFFRQNNFINQRRHMLLYVRFFDRMFNLFNGNYWDDWDGSGAYHIFGLLNWDFNPAEEPYNIEV